MKSLTTKLLFGLAAATLAATASADTTAAPAEVRFAWAGAPRVWVLGKADKSFDQALGVPVTIMSGPTTPRFELTDPASIGRVAKNFPQLKIVCYHGFWPYVNEMVGIAFRWDNVFVVADMYIFLPGGSLYVEAANGFMQDQLLFGSSYPFRAMAQSVEDYRALGFKESVIDKVMGGNAKQVLGL